MVVGFCEHPMVCLECTFKLRSLNSQKSCIYCKKELHDVVATADPARKYASFKNSELELFSNGIYTSDEPSKTQSQTLVTIECSFPKCKAPKLPNRSAL